MKEPENCPDRRLHVATYNIHKGFSQFNRRMVIHDLRQQLQNLDPDLLFLQEVQGLNLRHAARRIDWPDTPQHEFIAADTWHSAYGHNVAYDHGHHGNAILSRYPILTSHNQDVTHLRFERRGLLHAVVQPPSWDIALHCVCVHLSLFSRSRRLQMSALADQLEELAPAGTPLIVAGDFNDWRNSAEDLLASRLGLREAFGDQPTRSFPAKLPLFRLDRIYLRGFQVERTELHWGPPWSRISDHAALSARLIANGPRH